MSYRVWRKTPQRIEFTGLTWMEDGNKITHKGGTKRESYKFFDIDKPPSIFSFSLFNLCIFV